jgi:hypothetical protein
MPQGRTPDLQLLLSDKQERANLFARVFDNPLGEQVINYLDARFASRIPFHLGPDGQRKTDYAMGQHSLIGHIKGLIVYGKYGDEPPADEASFTDDEQF